MSACVCVCVCVVNECVQPHFDMRLPSPTQVLARKQDKPLLQVSEHGLPLHAHDHNLAQISPCLRTRSISSCPKNHREQRTFSLLHEGPAAAAKGRCCLLPPLLLLHANAQRMQLLTLLPLPMLLPPTTAGDTATADAAGNAVV